MTCEPVYTGSPNIAQHNTHTFDNDQNAYIIIESNVMTTIYKGINQSLLRVSQYIN